MTTVVTWAVRIARSSGRREARARTQRRHLLVPDEDVAAHPLAGVARGPRRPRPPARRRTPPAAAARGHLQLVLGGERREAGRGQRAQRRILQGARARGGAERGRGRAPRRRRGRGGEGGAPGEHAPGVPVRGRRPRARAAARAQRTTAASTSPAPGSRSSGASGASYGSLIPVKRGISPLRARAYRPLGVAAARTRRAGCRRGPPGTAGRPARARRARRRGRPANGLTSDTSATTPASASSLAASAVRRTFSARSSAEKPRLAFRP
jgi:hypothetical protein